MEEKKYSIRVTDWSRGCAESSIIFNGNDYKQVVNKFLQVCKKDDSAHILKDNTIVLTCNDLTIKTCMMM